MKGFSGFGNSPAKQTKVEKPKYIKGEDLKVGDYATYETTMYDKEGNEVTDTSEEFTGEVQINKEGRKFSTVEPGGSRDTVYWNKPK